MRENNLDNVPAAIAFSKDADRMRFAMNAAGIRIWEVDTVANKVIWDHRCRELFGLAKDNELAYEEAIRYIHPDDAANVNERVQAALRGDNGGKLYHAIEVADNGIGFDQQYAERIFRMFARLHGRGEYSGSGVGLSIEKKSSRITMVLLRWKAARGGLNI